MNDVEKHVRLRNQICSSFVLALKIDWYFIFFIPIWKCWFFWRLIWIHLLKSQILIDGFSWRLNIFLEYFLCFYQFHHICQLVFLLISVYTEFSEMFSIFFCALSVFHFPRCNFLTQSKCTFKLQKITKKWLTYCWPLNDEYTKLCLL